MSVLNGTRPGTKKEAVITGHKYQIGAGGEWDKLRENGRASAGFDADMEALSQKHRLAMQRCEVAKVMLHGGHVESSVMARTGLSVSMSPEQIKAAIVASL